MIVPCEVKTSVLVAMIAEDRREIRDLRSSVYNVISLLTAASFGVTAFLAKNPGFQAGRSIAAATDVAIVAFVWLLFCVTRRSLNLGRRCLKARQNLLRGLDESDRGSLDPFPDVSRVTLDLKDSDLWWFPVLATVAILVKLGLLLTGLVTTFDAGGELGVH